MIVDREDYDLPIDIMKYAEDMNIAEFCLWDHFFHELDFGL